MMGRHPLWLPLVLLLFLAGVSSWLNYTVQGADSAKKNESDPETIVENFEICWIDEKANESLFQFCLLQV